MYNAKRVLGCLTCSGQLDAVQVVYSIGKFCHGFGNFVVHIDTKCLLDELGSQVSHFDRLEEYVPMVIFGLRDSHKYLHSPVNSLKFLLP